MAGIEFTTRSVSVPDIALNGGLNSTSGPLGLANNEASDIQNIDFNKFGSILKRNGYAALNTSALGTSPDIDGLFWFEYDSSGVTTRKAIAIAGATILKMDDLDGTWDDITGALTITATNHTDFASFNNTTYGTNGIDVPWKWTGTGNAAVMTVPTGLTRAKYTAEYNNYLFFGNVRVSGVDHPSRIYWSNLKDADTWTATDFIDISLNDGQEITRIVVLSDRLVVYKTRSIYNVFFTGDADIPFILPGGGKSNSPVGCVAPFSVQEIDNGHMFLSYDGFYFYDGANSFKVSDRITSTLLGFNTTKFTNARSLVQKSKNRYWCALTSSGQTENDKVLVWDYFNNAWSVYEGLDPSAMATFYVNGTDERPYWGDYSGFVYRSDTGTDDYPLNSITAIDAYYKTNWRHYGDLVSKKGIDMLTLFHQITTSELTVAYSYDFDNTNQYAQSISLGTSSDVYGGGVYGTATYAKSGGDVKRIDMPAGRGRVIRYIFSNNIVSETFQIDGFGSLPHLQTNE